MAIITTKCKSFMLLLLLCISINFLTSEARPLDILKVQGSDRAFNWLNMAAIKNGLNLGSSHKFNSQIYLGIKNSGPSPGEGHKVTTGNHQ
ncbi:hypothetical protein H5410_009092 [Solanum commersonii]|uniref:Uncharacterized protein n=1 Tax=Solanum commersonii TaxID=4109 RepID=A0A9J6AII4_SOLCO|nr:hypothetical protein H5410_009092 [Solanum commersonii]